MLHRLPEQRAAPVQLLGLGEPGLLGVGLVDQPVHPLALAVGADRRVERVVGRRHAAVHLHHLVLGDVEPGGDLGDVLGVEVALLDRLDLALDAAQVEEQLLLGGCGADLHQRPGMQDIFLDRGADPPHRVGREPEAAVGVEPLDRLHHAHIAFRDQLAHRQPVAAIAGRDLGHQPQVAGHQPVRGLGVLVLAPALGQHELLVGLQEGEFPDLLQVARQVALGVELGDRRNRCCACRHRLLLALGAAGHAGPAARSIDRNPPGNLPASLQSVFQ